jgi:fibronectin type 3 domain-containing protein
VLTEDGQGRLSAPSARVSLLYVAAPGPPQALRAEPGEQQARLGWEAPTQRGDGSPISDPLDYEVLRAESPDGALRPVGRTAGGVTTFTDTNLENDRAYSYAVRAVGTAQGGTAIGEPSARVTVTPADMTPPSAPANLVAIPSPRTVRLSWSPSPERDVAGYVVYRAAGAGAFARVGSTRAPSTVFVDTNVPPGTHRYTVTARDAGARANESPRSNEVTVSVP